MVNQKLDSSILGCTIPPFRRSRSTGAKQVGIKPESLAQSRWLNLEEVASVEITSEAPNFHIERAFAKNGGQGWKAASPGRQTIRLHFHNPRTLLRIRLEFCETGIARTQEFSPALVPAQRVI
jgi:hypothetical protein